MQWDDLRLALAVADAGTAARAARKLGVAHTTVARRLASLEKGAGVRLFERVGQKLVPTAAGYAMLQLVTDFDARLSAFERSMSDVDRRLEGVVTVTAAELLGSFLVARLPLFRHRYPAIRLRLRVGPALLDLARREADVAIRVNPPPGSELVGQRVGHADFAVYGTREAGTLRTAHWVCFDDDVAKNPQAKWEERHVDPERVVLRTNSRATFIEAVRAGLGIGILPCAFADLDETLVRRGEPMPELRVPVWVLMHESVRDIPRVRAAAEFITESLRAASA